MKVTRYYSVSSDDLTKSLCDSVQKNGHPLDLFVKRVVGGVLSEFVVPWLVECLQKYDETEFHTKMYDSTWDFVNDWQSNHPKKFKAFIFGARRLRYAYDFNSKAITEQVVNILENNGWKIDDTESIQLYYTAESIRKMIEE